MEINTSEILQSKNSPTTSLIATSRTNTTSNNVSGVVGGNSDGRIESEQLEQENRQSHSEQKIAQQEHQEKFQNFETKKEEGKKIEKTPDTLTSKDGEAVKTPTTALKKRKKKFFASKTVAEEFKTNNQEGRAPSDIIYMHVQAETTDNYTDRQLNRMPVTFAMRLNDVGQQHRARHLLEQENQKVRSAKRVKPPCKKVNRSSNKVSRSSKPSNNKRKTPEGDSKVDTKSTPIGIASLYPLTYQGPPTDKTIDWPSGWIQHSYERPCKTRYDHYWYTPVTKRRLRSINEVKRMLALLKQNGNEEEDAWAAMKTRR